MGALKGAPGGESAARVADAHDASPSAHLAGEPDVTDHTTAPPRRSALALPLALAALLAAVPPAAAQSGGSPPTGSPDPGVPQPNVSSPAHPAFYGTGMWIWQLPRTYGGSVPRIVAKARRHGVRTLFIKSGDGTRRWSQFNALVVAAFKRAGLRVCGWQYVYGNRPLAEAFVSAYAREQGADCFAIDAESEYEGKYAAADDYVRKLRELVGPSYPLALTGFPYVHFHPAFPYSVFLAEGRAQVNQPQMYWYTIGTSVDRHFTTTYTWNRIYQRPIFPLGQTFDRAPAAQIRRFRQLAQSYGAGGVSWWEWTHTRESSWRAVGDPVAALLQYRPRIQYPHLRLRSRGDFVVWAQQHLYGAGHLVPIDGVFGTATRNAVLAFQQARGLAPTGALDQATWPVLLRQRLVQVRWRRTQRGSRAFPARAAGRRGLVAPEPRSATLRATRREIPPKP
jgi:Putative peptidoglycan binding domain